MMRLQSASEVFSTGANTATPALLTSASSRPKRLDDEVIARPNGVGTETSQVSASISSDYRRCRHRARLQRALDVEQRDAPAIGEKALCRRQPRRRAGRR